MTALRRVLAVARPVRGRLTLAVLAGSLSAGSGVGLIAVAAWLISRAEQRPPILELSVAVVAVRALALGRGVFRYAERLVGHDAAFRVLGDLRMEVWRRLEPLAPAALPALRRGDLLGRFVGDVDTTQDLFLRVLQPVGVAAVVGTASVVAEALLLPSAGLVLLGTLLVAALAVPAVTAAVARRADDRLAGVRGSLATQVVELLRAAPDLIAYGAAPARLQRLRHTDAELTRLARSSAGAAGLGAGLATLAGGGAVWGALVAGVPAVRSGALDGVLLAVVVLLPLAAFDVVSPLPAAVQTLTRVRRAAERIFAVVDAPPPVVEPTAPSPLPDPPYDVCARAVSARWPGADAPALNGVDLDLASGRRVAVVGASGAGKTTLAMTLLRFLDVERGTLRLGGTDLRDLAGDDVRRVVGLCAQDAHLFDSSIRENVRLARPQAADEEIRAALRGARLLDWVDGLPEGEDTFVGERGARVSGGQRQRIALARSLLAGDPVLVLDEPTAHLDPPTADALTADLLDATAGRTVLLVTHRLAGLEAVDEVLVVDEGRVVQRGRHADLLAAPGPYHDLATPTN